MAKFIHNGFFKDISINGGSFHTLSVIEGSFDRENESAALIQRKWRGRKQNLEDKKVVESNEDENKSATVIQNKWRKRQALKKETKNRENIIENNEENNTETEEVVKETENKLDVENDDENKSATLIQRKWRKKQELKEAKADTNVNSEENPSDTDISKAKSSESPTIETKEEEEVTMQREECATGDEEVPQLESKSKDVKNQSQIPKPSFIPKAPISQKKASTPRGKQVQAILDQDSFLFSPINTDSRLSLRSDNNNSMSRIPKPKAMAPPPRGAKKTNAGRKAHAHRTLVETPASESSFLTTQRMKQEESAKLVAKLRKEKMERERKKKRKLAAERMAFEKQLEIDRQSREERSKLIEQEKQARLDKRRRDQLERRKRIQEEIKVFKSGKVKNTDKPLHEKYQEEFEDKFVRKEAEERQQKLKELREYYAPQDQVALKQHEEKYALLREQQQREIERIRNLRRQQWGGIGEYHKGRSHKIALAEYRHEQEHVAQTQNARKERMRKRNQFGSFVREVFAPKVDPKMTEEIEQRIYKLDHPVEMPNYENQREQQGSIETNGQMLFSPITGRSAPASETQTYDADEAVVRAKKRLKQFQCRTPPELKEDFSQIHNNDEDKGYEEARKKANRDFEKQKQIRENLQKRQSDLEATVKQKLAKLQWLSEQENGDPIEMANLKISMLQEVADAEDKYPQLKKLRTEEFETQLKRLKGVSKLESSPRH